MRNVHTTAEVRQILGREFPIKPKGTLQFGKGPILWPMPLVAALARRQFQGITAWPDLSDFQPSHITATEAANRLGISRQRCHQLIRAGKLSATRVTGLVLVRSIPIQQHQNERNP